jgi:hypothetical protein
MTGYLFLLLADGAESPANKGASWQREVAFGVGRYYRKCRVLRATHGVLNGLETYTVAALVMLSIVEECYRRSPVLSVAQQRELLFGLRWPWCSHPCLPTATGESPYQDMTAYDPGETC